MKHKLASFFSVIFHPLLMCTMLFVVLIAFAPETILPFQVNTASRWLMVLMIFLTTFVIPALSLVILKLTHTITTLSLFDRKERVLPFFYTTIFYGLTAFLFGRQLGMDSIIVKILGGTAVLIFVGAMITTVWKISAHAAGVGGFLGFMLGLKVLHPELTFTYLIILAFTIAGLIMASRLYLNAHTPNQVYAGFGLGVFISFVTLYLS